MRRSDTLLQHQSDPRHRSTLIPTRCQKDDKDRVDLAAKTELGRCDRRSLLRGTKSLWSVSPTQSGAIRGFRNPFLLILGLPLGQVVIFSP